MELNGTVIKFDSLESIEAELEKTNNAIFKKDDYINLLEKRIVELTSEKKVLFDYYEALDNIRGNFKENYQLI